MSDRFGQRYVRVIAGQRVVPSRATSRLMLKGDYDENVARFSKQVVRNNFRWPSRNLAKAFSEIRSEVPFIPVCFSRPLNKSKFRGRRSWRHLTNAGYPNKERSVGFSKAVCEYRRRKGVDNGQEGDGFFSSKNTENDQAISEAWVSLGLTSVIRILRCSNFGLSVLWGADTDNITNVSYFFSKR